jgi:hypothetical protein
LVSIDGYGGLRDIGHTINVPAMMLENVCNTDVVNTFSY